MISKKHLLALGVFSLGLVIGANSFAQIAQPNRDPRSLRPVVAQQPNVQRQMMQHDRFGGTDAGVRNFRGNQQLTGGGGGVARTLPVKPKPQDKKPVMRPLPKDTVTPLPRVIRDGKPELMAPAPRVNRAPVRQNMRSDRDTGLRKSPVRQHRSIAPHRF